MKYLALTLALFVTTLTHAAKIEEELFVFGDEPALLKELIGHPDITVDHVHSAGFEVYGPKGLTDFLHERGVSFYNMKGHRKNVDDNNYPSYEKIKSKLEALARQYPHIARLSSIGKSVKGRELWVLKISDQVEVDEIEPEFKYISSMHGDEITGRELSLRLAQELLEKYALDPEIKALIDHTEIYILPSLNPDGSELRQRANAAGIDLNRNFPEAVRNDPNNSQGRQPETQAVMAFQAARNFALSANFHGGAVVANYPWDARYDRHPFDQLVQDLSLEYANLNPQMRDSSEFNRGITNGADWYVLYGGMQDWSYIWHNDLQITIELSDTKWPNYNLIEGFYQSNRDSMVRYLQLVHQGAGIKMADRSAQGRVEIINAQGASLGVYGFVHGEFYKVLSPGQYTFKVESGSLRRSVTVTVEEGRVEGDAQFIAL